MQKEYKLKSRNLYKKGDGAPFKVSRSGIDLFLECARCFYLDKVLGLKRPEGPPFNINKAVDTLLKKEFDVHRAKGTPHPLMKSYGIDAVPFSHSMMDEWRENFKGVQHLHEATNLIVTGAVDDIWVTPDKKLIVVDYKATAKTTEVSLDADWQIGYKRQMEVYQWLLRQNGFEVASTGYFVYCNGRTDLEAFDGRIEFDVKVLSYKGDDSWIPGALADIRKCLDQGEIPPPNAMCEYCGYSSARNNILRNTS